LNTPTATLGSKDVDNSNPVGASIIKDTASLGGKGKKKSKISSKAAPAAKKPKLRSALKGKASNPQEIIQDSQDSGSDGGDAETAASDGPRRSDRNKSKRVRMALGN
jgi:hypothetical protein